MAENFSYIFIDYFGKLWKKVESSLKVGEIERERIRERMGSAGKGSEFKVPNRAIIWSGLVGIGQG